MESWLAGSTDQVSTRRAKNAQSVCQAFVPPVSLMNFLITPLGMQVFGLFSTRRVGYILAEPPAKGASTSEAVDTVAPLAAELGLSIDTSWFVIPSSNVFKSRTLHVPPSSSDDKDCVGDAASAFAAKSSASILICWESEYIPDIAEVLGVNDEPDYPANRYVDSELSCLCNGTPYKETIVTDPLRAKQFRHNLDRARQCARFPRQRELPWDRWMNVRTWVKR